jgi:hypothetical protein
MKVLLPLCVFPSVHWYACIAQHREAYIDLGEHYVKQSLRNRYEIAGASGRLWLTIPVEGTQGLKKSMAEIQIFGQAWGRQHFRTIRAAYGRSPFFDHYADDLNAFFISGETSLAEFSLRVLRWLSEEFLLPLPEVLSAYQASWEGADLRPAFKNSNTYAYPVYVQVFRQRSGFLCNLSVLDVVMNEGPAAAAYLQSAGVIQG